MKNIFNLFEHITLLRHIGKTSVRFQYDVYNDKRFWDEPANSEWDRFVSRKTFGDNTPWSDGKEFIKSVSVVFSDNWKKKFPMYPQDNHFKCDIELSPGLHNYKFLVNEDILISDPCANSDLEMPDLITPGIKMSGIIVYPVFCLSENRNSQIKTIFDYSRAKIASITNNYYQLKLASPSFPGSTFRLALPEGLIDLERIDTFNHIDYFQCKFHTRELENAFLILSDHKGTHELYFGPDFTLCLQKEQNQKCLKIVENPDWHKEAIWYVLIPDRFRYSGNSEEIKKNWKSDYYRLKGDEKNYYPDIFFRRYGGNLQGIKEKIPYLLDLGINALCLTPVFYGKSYHNYDTIDLRHVAPVLGSNPEQDIRLIEEAGETDDPRTWILTNADKEFLELVKSLHDCGIRVIVDGVFSHVGENFWAFMDLQKNGFNSKYFNWFRLQKTSEKKQNSIELSGQLHEYACFYNMAHMPKLNWTETGLHNEIEIFIFNITKRWMLPEYKGGTGFGIDGWRLDVANEMPFQFWNKWCEYVKSLKPDVYIVGEMLGSAYEPYLDARSFTAIINYRFGLIAVDYFINRNPELSIEDLKKYLQYFSNNHEINCTYAMQNVLDSHDLDRIVSRIKNRNRPYGTQCKLHYSHHHYDGSRPSDYNYEELKLVICFQIACIGAPALLYGTEAGMWGANDPHNRKPMLWEDLGDYEDEVLTYPVDPNNSLAVDKVTIKKYLYQEIKELLSIRRQFKSLSFGEMSIPYSDESKKSFAMVRSIPMEPVLIFLFNNSTENQILKVDKNKLLPVSHQSCNLSFIHGGNGSEPFFEVTDKYLKTEINMKNYQIFRTVN